MFSFVFALDVCALSKDPGPCSDVYDSWYYDDASDECLQFNYGGCEGNANRFETRDACERQCKKMEATTERVTEETPIESGDEYGEEVIQLLILDVNLFLPSTIRCRNYMDISVYMHVHKCV